ncbi:hypothetical protein C8J55DRAFT_494167 [Lentinula edodes]|uniref:Uncharacterized protein n=1 Tax=Lentinula lateritia TaxID=40482 RepID=A0A9W8ZPZ7_9AGAR|nr:hypothetical protein C8J55DRAFT_494167 [Lentinula edodes]
MFIVQKIATPRKTTQPINFLCELGTVCLEHGIPMVVDVVRGQDYLFRASQSELGKSLRKLQSTNPTRLILILYLSCMVHKADNAVVKYGKHKRTSKKTCQKCSKAAREASLRSQAPTSPISDHPHKNTENPTDNYKENDDPQPGSSAIMPKADLRADKLKKDVDKHRKKSTNWKGKTVVLRGCLSETKKELNKHIEEEEQIKKIDNGERQKMS